jgi:exodeoxyribonuclease V alpha subunit
MEAKKKTKIVEDKQLSLEQDHAVIMCCDVTIPVASVTGAAGTGKTLVLGEVYRELRTRRRLVALCAPTGRAAKRIQELTGISAKTIHRLLEFPMPDEYLSDDELPSEPRRNKNNPLDEQVVICDEASMLSPTLYRQLCDAMPRNGIIRFFGDNNQLPPVEEGDPPFISLLKTEPMVQLTWNYRSGDMVLENANRILRGSVPMRNPCFEILYTDNPLALLVDFATKDFMKDDHQIIMPTRKGKHGTIRINPSLQMKFNKSKEYLRLDRYDEKEATLVLKAKDKFLWIKNDYKLDMFNGELGQVEWVDADEGSVGLVMGEREVVVPPRVKTYNNYIGTMINYDPRKQIELGYAITTHKSQGSEFKTVIYCIGKGQMWLLNRRNFYTAVTRAKQNVILITDRKAMGLSLRKHQQGH